VREARPAIRHSPRYRLADQRLCDECMTPEENADAVLAAAIKALPVEMQQRIRDYEREWCVERTISHEAEIRGRRLRGEEHPLKRYPPIAEFLNSWESQETVDDGTDITYGDWAHWLLDSHLIGGADRGSKWVCIADRIQGGANATIDAEPVLYRGECWSDVEIARYPVSASFQLRRLTSTTPIRELAAYYAALKFSNLCKFSPGESRSPVVLAFRDARGVTGIRVPPRWSPTFKETVLPKGSVYRVSTVDRVDSYMHLGLSVASARGSAPGSWL